MDRRDDIEYNGDDDNEVRFDLVALSGHCLLEASNLSSCHLLLLPLLAEQKDHDDENDKDDFNDGDQTCRACKCRGIPKSGVGYPVVIDHLVEHDHIVLHDV